MNQYEYEQAIDEINKTHARDIKQLNCKYAKQNQKFKVGDTIKSKVKSIVIDEIMWGFYFGKELPEIIYFGFELTKKGEFRKDKSRAKIYQQEVVSCNINHW